MNYVLLYFTLYNALVFTNIPHKNNTIICLFVCLLLLFTLFLFLIYFIYFLLNYE